MLWRDAKILIDELKRLRSRRGLLFLNRLECCQPERLAPEDKRYLEFLYEKATERAMSHKKKEGDYVDA